MVVNESKMYSSIVVEAERNVLEAKLKAIERVASKRAAFINLKKSIDFVRGADYSVEQSNMLIRDIKTVVDYDSAINDILAI